MHVFKALFLTIISLAAGAAASALHPAAAAVCAGKNEDCTDIISCCHPLKCEVTAIDADDEYLTCK
ncbi:hypothetical protein DFH09DRAFT_1372257 [Mycena vulgaris]|nr:hypothetical protein DFH09DRAFT_1372257 [Mycena vulgaris]